MRGLCLLPFLAFSGIASAAETEPAKYAGLKELQVGTEVEAVRAGEIFYVGLHFRHEKGYHTYWKSPGVVGVPAMVEWEDGLPEGFEVGEFEWPAPQTTLMATLTAWGYETDTTVLIPITPPADLGEEKSVTLSGRIGWMCCATSCHPGWHDFTLTLPVASAGETIATDEKWKKRFEEARSRFPRAAPEGWQFEARDVDNNTIQLVVRPPEEAGEVDWAQVYFFSDDNQVDSDAKQKASPLLGAVGGVLTFSRPDFAPENPPRLSGVLYLEEGWPGMDGHPWMIASAPWPEYVEPADDGEDEKEEEVR